MTSQIQIPVKSRPRLLIACLNNAAFLSCLMAFAMSSFSGLLQSIGNKTAAGGIFALCTGGCRLRTELKCLTHRFIFSSRVLSVLPFFVFYRMASLSNLFVRDLITSYRTLMLFCLAASSASDVKVVMKFLLSFLALFFTSLSTCVY